MSRGALRLLSDAYLQNGDVDAGRTIAVFTDAIEQALARGFTGFRAAAEMSWALGLPDGMNRLIAYESLLRKVFSTCRVAGLCLYPRNQMPLEVLNGALATHPIAGTQGAYSENPYYDPDVTVLPDVDGQAVLEKLRHLERRH
jgi:hypothetical protein